MKKKDVIDLITAHYEGDDRLFFFFLIEVLKEFQTNEDKELVDYVSNRILGKVRILPKREVSTYEPEINFEDAEILGWTLVPQEKSNE